MTTPGHNAAAPTTSEEIKAFVARIERLEDEKRDLAADIRELYAEAREQGFEPKHLRAIVAERRMSAEERAEREEALDRLRAALGMLDGTPLGDAARSSSEALARRTTATRRRRRAGETAIARGDLSEESASPQAAQAIGQQGVRP